MADRIIDLMYLKYLKAAISYHKETEWRLILLHGKPLGRQFSTP